MTKYWWDVVNSVEMWQEKWKYSKKNGNVVSVNGKTVTNLTELTFRVKKCVQSALTAQGLIDWRCSGWIGKLSIWFKSCWGPFHFKDCFSCFWYFLCRIDVSICRNLSIFHFQWTFCPKQRLRVCFLVFEGTFQSWMRHQRSMGGKHWQKRQKKRLPNAMFSIFHLF